MTNPFKKAKTVFQKVKDFFPTRLPIGMTEFKTWSDTLVSTYNFPDNDSIRFSLASMILHLGSTSAYKANRFFVLSMKKAMANQIAAAVMQELKTRQEEQRKQEAAAATAASETPSDVALQK